MNDEPTPFIDYWQAVDAVMLKLFGIDTTDTGIDAELIASAQEGISRGGTAINTPSPILTNGPTAAPAPEA